LIHRLLISLVSIGLNAYHQAPALTKDGLCLLQDKPPSPHHLRALPRLLAGKRIWAWCLLSWGSLVVACQLFPGDLWACALFVSLPWYRLMVQAPVLADAPALVFTLAATRLPLFGLLAGATSEKAFAFIALYSQSWTAAGLALAATLYVILLSNGNPREAMPPLQIGRLRAFRWISAGFLVLPWGAGMAALASPSWTPWEALTVVVAYGQLLAAWDTSRLYMWAAPVVLPKAVAVLPSWARLPAVVATWFNPWAAPGKRGEIVC
jgi:hypothetical protein